MYEPPDYTEYTLDQLYDVYYHVDRDQYPENYQAIVNEIKNRKAELPVSIDNQNKSHVEEVSSKEKWFTSPAALDSLPFPSKYIFLGLLIPALIWLFMSLLGQWEFIRYRPWIATPAFFFLQFLFYVSMIVFAVIICKKLLYWPLAHMKSFRQVLSELLKSLLILLPINFIIGAIVLTVGAVFDINIKETHFVQVASFGFNSWQLIILLILGFTITPVIEELFFRGFLYNALKTRTSLSIATIIQAAIFTFYHQYDLLASLTVFLLGIALAIIYEKRKNLLAPIFVHGLSNALIMIPLLVLSFQNLHPVAANWDEAQQNPDWLSSSVPTYVERQANGVEQWEYAIDTWGSRGARKWKMEANAFNAIPLWFPEDNTASAKAKLGIVTIYYQYLRDYRRAILAAEELIASYPYQKEQCASALTKKGWSYYMIKEFKKSREAFQTVINKYYDNQDQVESAQEGLKWLQSIGY